MGRPSLISDSYGEPDTCPYAGLLALAPARPDKRAALSLEASWWVLAITLQRLRPGVRNQGAGFQALQLALPCKGNACIPKVIIRTVSRSLRE